MTKSAGARTRFIRSLFTVGLLLIVGLFLVGCGEAVSVEGFDSSGIPGGDIPGGDIPGGDIPGGDIPGGDIPGGDIPGGDIPGGDVPGSLMLSWTPPTTNEDGTPLEDLAGYKLYYGNQSGNYTKTVTVGSYYTTAEIGGLNPGTYYLAITAYDIYGNESEFSNEINHTIF